MFSIVKNNDFSFWCGSVSFGLFGNQEMMPSILMLLLKFTRFSKRNYWLVLKKFLSWGGQWKFFFALFRRKFTYINEIDPVWPAPAGNCIKINVDAALGDGPGSCPGIARDSSGHIVCCLFLLEPLSLLLLKLQAFFLLFS